MVQVIFTNRGSSNCDGYQMPLSDLHKPYH
jgi:hypothetical protein